METKLIPSQPFKPDHMLVAVIMSILHRGSLLRSCVLSAGAVETRVKDREHNLFRPDNTPKRSGKLRLHQP